MFVFIADLTKIQIHTPPIQKSEAIKLERKTVSMVNDGERKDGKIPINAEATPITIPATKRKLFSIKTSLKMSFLLNPKAMNTPSSRLRSSMFR
jgi:hypothetical protein